MYHDTSKKGGFGGKMGGFGGGRGGARFGGGSRFGGGGNHRGGFDRPMYPAVCNDFGAERSEGSRVDRRPEKRAERPSRQVDTDAQLKMINATLTKILNLLESMTVLDDEDPEEDGDDDVNDEEDSEI